MLTRSRTEATAKVYEGPALIMKAYMTGILTDLYGDVLYFKALKGKEGITTPVYSKQEEIYSGTNGILDNLDKANAAIKSYTSPQKLSGDILFSGNLTSWVKFANSLKIKYLMRISDCTSSLICLTENMAIFFR